ncbi:MAG: hypothetical protein HQL01_13460 [Nitrospirae bacterium]|nr:hypothetical protein [Nitrospirota bacterium]
MRALKELAKGLGKKFKQRPPTLTGGRGRFEQSLTVCYARLGACDFYKISKAGISAAAREPSSLINRLTGKNILVLGKELFYYWREKYPPAIQKNLKGIISNDAAELFPMIAKPSFHYKVFEAHANYTIVDIWAWESRVADELTKGVGNPSRKDFYFNYLIPEDLLFRAEAPEAAIYAEGGKIYAIAYGPNGFIGFRTLSPPLKEGDIEVFLRSLGAYRQQLKAINLSGITLSAGMDIPPVHIIDNSTGCPVSLLGLNSFKLAPFRTKTWHSALDTQLLFRIAMYSMAAYLVSSFLSIKKLDTSIEDIEKETSKVTKQINELAELQDKDVTAKLLIALAKKVSEFTPPLDVIEVLTRAIPEGSYVTQLNITNRNVDVYIVSADPSGVISKLSTSKEVEAVKLVGEPTREGQTYKFRLSIDMRDTISASSSASSPAAITTASIPQAVVAPQAVVSKASIPAAIMNANPNSVASPLNRASSPSAIMKTNKIF